MSARIPIYVELSTSAITQAFEDLDYHEMLEVILVVSKTLKEMGILEDVVKHLSDSEDFQDLRKVLVARSSSDPSVVYDRDVNIGGTG